MTDIQKLLEDRAKIHGDAETTHRTAYCLFEYLDKHSPNNILKSSSKAMLFLIMVKIARGVQNPSHADHWDDLAGYAELIKRVECQ